MNIHDIANRTRKTSPYFFTPDTLAFFGQNMSSFTVEKYGAHYRISAPSYWGYGSARRLMGHTVRYFDPQTNELLTEDEYNRIEEAQA